MVYLTVIHDQIAENQRLLHGADKGYMQHGEGCEAQGTGRFAHNI